MPVQKKAFCTGMRIGIFMMHTLLPTEGLEAAVVPMLAPSGAVSVPLTAVTAGGHQ
jgi:hypothetical protein